MTEVQAIIEEAQKVGRETSQAPVVVLARTVAMLSRGASPGFMRAASVVSPIPFNTEKGRPAL